MYDRAIILEKGRAGKTNFPLHEYDQEAAAFESFVAERCGCQQFTLHVISRCLGHSAAKWVSECSLAFADEV